ncbi:MAG: hypothetical protein LRY33_03425 [Parabacteroides chartae]|nr:hypothetical protein [Parabacteroides chartae]
MLDEATSILVQSSVLLKELFSTENPERRNELCRLIKAEEVKGDKITKQTFKALMILSLRHSTGKISMSWQIFWTM